MDANASNTNALNPEGEENINSSKLATETCPAIFMCVIYYIGLFLAMEVAVNINK